MNYLDKYQQWLNSDFIDEETKNELLAIKDNDEEIKDRFYRDLEFGTAGLRGKMGAGLNRMNKYVISRAAQALANVIIKHGSDAMEKGVAISYDVRYGSSDYAKITAGVLAANNIKSYIYSEMMPTPMLSFAIRYYHTISGVMVTASHNPQVYNGYKVYWQEGSQILDDIADQIAGEIDKIEFSQIKMFTFEQALNSGYANYIGNDCIEEYYRLVLGLSIHDDIDKDINISYSPLHGTGNKPVRHILKERGFKNVFVVPEQEQPDPKFSTATYPNPEFEHVFEYSKKNGLKNNCDILIATDPDCDRLALCVRDNTGNYQFVNGNKIGALLTNYIFSNRYQLKTLPKNAALVKSIVTGDLSKVIASKYGVTTIETLTGFKNICGKANEFDETKEYTYVLGYEESIGYCYGTFVRDKDGVSAAMMICEMAAYYKKQGLSLLDVLDNLYSEFGYYNERQYSFELEGITGQKQIQAIVKHYRELPLKNIDNLELVEVVDYLEGINDLPKQNCLKYVYNDGSWFSLRPSGTEPKLKVYLYSIGCNYADSVYKLDLIEKMSKDKINKFLESWSE